ncbi:nucleotide-binding protein [Rhodoferax sp.]|uniref:nucleotide-binding protein n=1 Tax=Rhodoferax sp. TaxID=50421 RepID=UPI00374DD84B
MKKLLLVCLLTATPFATSSWAADKVAPVAPAALAVSGEVLEVKEVEIYTYLRLKTKDGEMWAAVSKTPVKVGANVTIKNAMAMKNFESKTLKKTFPTILFGSLGGVGQASAGAPAAVTKVADTSPIKVDKASGANARTVAEVITKATELNGKTVRVSGKVVKYNSGIMGKNWIHLRDGTGLEANGSNDVLVTTTAEAKVGAAVTVTGVVRTNKDFGAGYNYKVLIEDAKL